MAEAAFNYAAGPRIFTGGSMRRYSCGIARSEAKTVNDRGPCSGPRDDEPDHGDDCQQLAAAVAEWEAGRETDARFTDLDLPATR